MEKSFQKIAVISDIHGNFLALEEVIKDIDRRNVELVINLGDHISGPIMPKETIEFLMKKNNWINISGNHDRQLIEQNPDEHGASDRYAFKFLNNSEKEWLKNLPKNLIINNEIFLFHGTPDSDLVYLLETVEEGSVKFSSEKKIEERLNGKQNKLMLCGHSHIPRAVEIKGSTIVNPGSVGLQAYLSDIPEPHKVESGLTHARYATLEKVNEIWVIDFISIPYDKNKAADIAKMNEAFEWEAGLRSGFISL